jgi:Beta-lactamase superfamily domain
MRISGAGQSTISARPADLDAARLPPVHLVLISHDHYDHLDRDTVRRLAAAHDPLFLVPLELKRWFAEQSITRVKELDWWQSTHEPREVTLVKGQSVAEDPLPEAVAARNRRTPRQGLPNDLFAVAAVGYSGNIATIRTLIDYNEWATGRLLTAARHVKSRGEAGGHIGLRVAASGRRWTHGLSCRL